VPVSLRVPAAFTALIVLDGAGAVAVDLPGPGPEDSAAADPGEAPERRWRTVDPRLYGTEPLHLGPLPGRLGFHGRGNAHVL
jgi:hypothetical protein